MKAKQQIFAIFLGLLLIAPASAFAQEGEVYVSLAGGASIPLLDYAAVDFSDPSSGFARTGGNFAINFGYRLNQYLSVTGLLSGSVNRFDYVELQNWLTDYYKESLPDTRWLVETKSWGLGGLMAGITGSLPLSPNKIFLDGRLLGGFTYVYSPAMSVTGLEDNEEDLILYIDQYSAISWAIDLGAGFRYHRSRNQSFTLYADYLLANPQYNNVSIQDNDPELQRETSFTQRVSAVNITLGIGYIVN